VEALIDVLDQHAVGDAVRLSVYRGGQIVTLEAVLGPGTSQGGSVRF